MAPEAPRPDDDDESGASVPPEDAAGVELGLSEDEGSTFEPEEDDQVPE
jgi:hypothetical protein